MNCLAKWLNDFSRIFLNAQQVGKYLSIVSHALKGLYILAQGNALGIVSYKNSVASNEVANKIEDACNAYF